MPESPSSPSHASKPAADFARPTRLQAELSRRLVNLASAGTADERQLVARLPRVQSITSMLEWLREPGSGLDLIELLRFEVQELWREQRRDDRAVELAAVLFLVGAEGRILEKLSNSDLGHKHLHLSVDDQTSAAILGSCLLDRGVHFEVDFGRAVIKARNVVSDFEIREPGKDTGLVVTRRAIASVESVIAGRMPGDGLASVDALQSRLRVLDDRRGIRLAVALPHGDPAGMLSEPGVTDFLQNLEVPVFFYGVKHSSANLDQALLAQIEGDMRGQLRDILMSMRPPADASVPHDTLPRPLVFYSYSHEPDDAKWNQNVIAQLRVLEVLGKIALWVDESEIGAGERWDDKVQAAIDQASVAVLMISKHFIKSPYIRDRELPPLLTKEKAGRLRLVPVLLGACSWNQDAELQPLQLAAGTIPLNTKTEIGELDLATAKIAKAIADMCVSPKSPT